MLYVVKARAAGAAIINNAIQQNDAWQNCPIKPVGGDKLLITLDLSYETFVKPNDRYNVKPNDRPKKIARKGDTS